MEILRTARRQLELALRWPDSFWCSAAQQSALLEHAPERPLVRAQERLGRHLPALEWQRQATDRRLLAQVLRPAVAEPRPGLAMLEAVRSAVHRASELARHRPARVGGRLVAQEPALRRLVRAPYRPA